MVVAVVGIKWHRGGIAKNADWRNRNAFKSLPRKSALISIFNGGGSICNYSAPPIDVTTHTHRGAE